MDKYRIDSHKLIYHVERVNDWLKGKDIYPIYVEIATSGACNHRCIYCALDYMGYQPIFLDTFLLKNRLSEMARLGIKSIMYAGEGEPLLHKDIIDIINYTKKSGIDVAITTNGVLLNKSIVDYTLGNIDWIKISIDAGTKETYAKIHNTAPGDFDRVIKNISYAVKVKDKKNYKCALGMQLILLPDNYTEITILAKIAKNIGMDYLVIKPYSQHPLSKTTKYKGIKYSRYFHLSDKTCTLSDKKFNVIFRINTMEKWDEGLRNYKHCYALPFWSYIDAGGNLWGCSAYLGDKRFLYGNIYKHTFKEIRESKRRKIIMQMAQGKLDTTECRVNCRMDEINRYLWELRHPPEHVNFI